ncbi:MAG: hypothetical protein ACRC6U_10895 [Fusobacteriaceae bacterium]
MIDFVQDLIVEKTNEIFTEKIRGIIKTIFLGKENYNSISKKYKKEISISDLIFIKKFFYFNNGYGKLGEKVEFINRYNKEEWKNKIESLLFVIDGMNNLKKIETTGKIFRLFLLETLTYEEYLECIHILDMMQYEDLLKLKKLYLENKIEEIAFQENVPILLFKASSVGLVIPKRTHGNHYLVTDIGEIFFKEEILK